MRRFGVGAGLVVATALRSRALLLALRVAGGVLTAVAIVGAIAFGGLMLRLTRGPIEVNELGQRAAAALTSRFDGNVQFSFGATRIARTEHGPTITVDHLQAVAAGRTVVEAPRAELSLDPLALLRLEAMPRRIEVFDLTVRLLVTPDGALAISAGGPNEEAIVLARPTPPAVLEPPPAGVAAPAGDQPRRSIVLKEAAGALRAFFDLATSPKSPLAALRNIAVHGGALVVVDRTADRTTTFQNLEMSFEKSRRSAAFAFDAQGPNGKLSAVAQATGAPNTERQLDIEVRNVTMDEFVLIAGLRRPAFDSDASMSLKLRFILEATKELREASGRAIVGAGYFRLEDPDHEPMFFDEITGGFHWDTVNQRLIIDPVQYYGGQTQFFVAGALDPPARPQDGWRLTLGLAKPGAIAPEHPGDKLLTIDHASVDARIHPEDRRCEIVRAEMTGPELAMAAIGAIDWANGPHVRMGLSTGRMPMRALYRVWPTHMGAPARNWLVTHTHGGTILSGKASVDFDKDALLAMRFDRPPPDAAVSMDFQIANASVTAFDGVPDIIGIDGSGHVTGRGVIFNETAGTLETGPGRKLTLASGSFVIPHNDGGPAVPAYVETHLGGSVEAVADLLSKEPIKDYASLPLEPGSLKGQVDGKVRVDFKIGPATAADDVKIAVNANVSNFSADHLLGKEKFEAGALIVTSDPNGIHAAGTGRLFGQPATLDLHKYVGLPTVANLTATIDDAGRTKLGYSPKGVAGPIGMKLGATLAEGETRIAVDLDLARVELDNPIPGVIKDAGKPGRATFTLIQRDGAVRIEDLVADLGAAAAKGSIDLSPQGEFQSARLTQARLSPGDDMRVDIQKTGDMLKATVRGASIDARPFIKSLTQTSDSGSTGETGNFDLDLKTPVLSGFTRQALVNADLKIARKADSLLQFAMSGQFGRASFAAALGRGDNGQPQVNVSTNDAGALLGFADLYPRMEGGTLNAAMQFGGKALNGMVTIRSFALRDEPALRRLVNEGSPRVDPNSGARVDTSLARFDRLQVVFSRSGGQLTLRDGVMNGPNIGLTVEGVIDNDRDVMALNGTFIPAYTVNNFFSKIPVVGLLLGGGWNEGLFAVNYKIAGRPGAPQISINPLTVAPGFLRKIFGVLDSATTPEAPVR